MNVFELSAILNLNKDDYEKGLNEAHSEAESFGSKLKAGLGTAAKLVGGAILAGGAAVTALTTQSVKAYANYEQLTGGVETLFGRTAEQTQMLKEGMLEMGMTAKEAVDKIQLMADGADIVMKNAAAAYKTAGLSANQYMETVTSFSASLIQSLNGDTVAAADVADRAIRDMSDNANKMGTDMSMIQSAYQGFAKQNYTMLDNLKLGYGGTKTEMERLIADASEMTDVMDKLGITVDATDMSFGNIVNAISVMQEKMGIAGTTEQEAAETISGSIGMMKSAWENLVTGMADETADFDGLINNLVESVDTVAANIMPRVEVALGGVASLIEKLAPTIAERLPGLISEVLPKLLSAGTEIVNAVIGVLPSILESVATAIIENAPVLISGVIGLITSVAQALPDLILTLIEALPALLETIAAGITENLPVILDTLSESLPTILTTLFDTMVEILPTLITSITKVLPTLIQKIVTALVQNLPILINGMITLITSLAQELPTIISALVEILPELISTIVTALVDNAQLLIDGIITLVTLLAEQAPVIITQLVDAIIEALPDLINGLITLVTMIVENLPTIIMALVDALPTIITSIINGLIVALPQLIQGAIQIVVLLVQHLPEIIMALIEAIPVIIQSIIDAFAPLVTSLGEKAGEAIDAIITWFKELPGKIAYWLARLYAQYTEFIMDLPKNFKEWLDKTITKVKEFFINLTTQAREKGTQFKDDLIAKVKELPDKIKEIGRNIVDGLKNGIKEKWDALVSWFEGLGQNLIAGWQSVFDMHSPSKVFAEMGGYMAKGLQIGWDEEFANVQRDMENVSFDMNVSANHTAERNDTDSEIVALLKEILNSIPGGVDKNSIFKIVKRQNDEYKETTGVSAFA